jgi:hypothetical protein
MEPYVTWTEPVLKYRADCYEAHGHPLRQHAARELAAYRAGSGADELFEGLPK